MKFYTGIGSRETPSDICVLMEDIAMWLSEDKGYTLRSGHAMGADWAFEQGAKENSVIYLPWPTFGTQPYKEDPGRKVLGTPYTNEPLWRYLYQNRLGKTPSNTPTALLHGRNVAQVIGHDVPSVNSDFVLFWAQESLNKTVMGGTGIAVRFAETLRIPCFNLFRPEVRTRLEKALNS